MKWAENKEAGSSTYPKGGVSCSKDSFVVVQSSFLRLNICGEKPVHRKCAKRRENILKLPIS